MWGRSKQILPCTFKNEYRFTEIEENLRNVAMLMDDGKRIIAKVGRTRKISNAQTLAHRPRAQTLATM